MEWTQFLILIVTIGTLFLWNRSESNSDRRAFQANIDAMREEMKDFHKEMKDFHSRLEKQDYEFKSFMKEIELRRTKILLREE